MNVVQLRKKDSREVLSLTATPVKDEWVNHTQGAILLAVGDAEEGAPCTWHRSGESHLRQLPAKELASWPAELERFNGQEGLRIALALFQAEQAQHGGAA